MKRLIPIFFAFFLLSACAGMQPEPARQLTLEETLRLAEGAGAGKKISDLSQETNIQDTDEMVIRRGSDNYRAEVQYLPSANPSDQFNKIKNAYYASTNASVTDHADTAQSGSIADIITNEMSGAQGDIILPGNKTYQTKQALTIPTTARLMPQKGAIIDTDISIRDANYKWTLSGSGTNEYYLEATTGGNPNINEPDDVAEDDSLMTETTVGSLSAGEWDWGNNDTLGFNTVYVRLSDSTDPDGKATDYVEAGYTLTINSSFEPGNYQVFSGIGRVVFGVGAVRKFRPELWGAVAGAPTHDSLPAINAMITSMATMPNGAKAYFVSDTYYISETWTMDTLNNLVFEGSGGIERSGVMGTCIQPMNAFTGTEIIKIDNCMSIEGKGINIYARDPSASNQYNGLVIVGDNTPATFFIKWEKFGIRKALTAIWIGSTSATDYQFQNCTIRDFSLSETENIGIHIRSRNVDNLTIDNGAIVTSAVNCKCFYFERSGLCHVTNIAGAGGSAAGSTFVSRGIYGDTIVMESCAAENVDYYMLDLCTTARPIIHINPAINDEYKIDQATGINRTIFIGGHIRSAITFAASNIHVFSYGMSEETGFSLGSYDSAYKHYYRIPHLDTYAGTFTWDPPSIGAGATSRVSHSIAGAEIGRAVIVTAPYDLTGIILFAECNAASTVTIILYNPTAGAIDLASNDWNYKIFPLE